jgi:uncharacterized protein (UPF0332 family)
MINEKRIKEAESNVKNYLEEGFLKKVKETLALPIFVKNAKESLKAAKIMNDNNIFLWTIVSSYYSMFYISNAVLLKLGYKVGDKIVHKVTADSLIVLVKDKLKLNLLEDYDEVKEEALRIAEIKSDEILESFDLERKKRSFIQYQTSQEDINQKAQTSLKRAQEFLFEMESLL